jgi:hypothetical protein
MPRLLIRAAARRIVRSEMRRTFFPPRSGTVRQLRRFVHPSGRLAPCRSDWFGAVAAMYGRFGVRDPTIANKLTERAIQTPGGARKFGNKMRGSTNWSAATVYRILTDHSIAGTYYHGRFKRAKRGDKYPERTDPSEWNAIAIEPIISPEEFAAIAKKLSENKYLSPRNSKRFYLLGRRIKCTCGHSLAGDTHRDKRVYRCVGSKSVAVTKCKPTVELRADVIEPFVWNWLVTQLEPANLRAGLEAEREQQADAIAELTRQIAIQEKQKGELQGRIVRIEEGFNGGFYTLDEAMTQKTQLRPAIKSVEEELERLNTLLSQIYRNTDDDTALLAEAEELYSEAKEITDHIKKRALLDRLAVTVVIERKDKEYWAEMSCFLGARRERILPETSQ